MKITDEAFEARILELETGLEIANDKVRRFADGAEQ